MRKNVEGVVHGPATITFDRADWIGLALAALDQAGVSPRELAEAYQHAKPRGDFGATIEELSES